MSKQKYHPEKCMGNELHYIMPFSKIADFDALYDMDLSQVLKEYLNRMN